MTPRSPAPVNAGRSLRVTEAVRSGAWLTAERLRVYPRLIGGLLLLGVIGLIATAHGDLDAWRRPLGVDFSGVWVAGREVLAGHPAAPYDNAAHAQAQVEAFGASGSYLPWSYPPFFLLLAAALASVPYLAALALWQAATLVLYLAAVVRAGRDLPPKSLPLPALAFPAVAINLLHGQNGFLSAGLLTWAAVWLPRRPLPAGVLMAFACYKPQLALVLPLVVLVGRFGRAGAAALLTLSVMVAATWALFGPKVWWGFFNGLTFARQVILEQGGIEPYKLQSAFGAARLLGLPVAAAYAAQALASGAALVVLIATWRGHTDGRLRLISLLLAALMVSPYVVDYDLVVLGPALAAWVALGVDRGFAPYEKSLLAAAWLMPLVSRLLGAGLHIPFGFLVLAGLLSLLARRAAAPRCDFVSID